MESNIQNETTMNEVISNITPTAEEMTTQPTTELEGTTPHAEGDISDPNHPHHHMHNSALGAAAKAHSAVHHVMPHHRKLDL